MEKLIVKKYLKKKDYVSLSLASFSSSAISGLAQGYLLIFYTGVLGISPIATGIMFLLAKIWDGINDPIMGVIVDKTRTKWGKMRPYLIFGSIPLGIITIVMFIPVEMAMANKIVFMYVTYFLYGMIGTLVGVPLGGLAVVSSPNTNERTKIMSISRIFGAVGDQSALVLISIGFLIFRAMGTIYFVAALIIGVLAPIFMIIAGVNIKERIKPIKSTPKILDGFKYLFKNKPFLLIFFSNLLTFFRHYVSAMIIYVVTYIYFNGSLQIWFALPGAIASMLGMLMAPSLKKRMDAKQLFIFASIWHSVALALVFLVGIKAWYIVAAFMFIAMLPVGVLTIIPNLMVADTIDYWEHKHGQRQEGIAFSLMSLRSKVSSGFKDLTLGLFLTFFLFGAPLNDLISSHLPSKFEHTRNGIFMLYTIIPAVLNLTCIFPMFFYKLSGKRMAIIQEELQIRRELREKESAESEHNAENTIGGGYVNSEN